MLFRIIVLLVFTFLSLLWRGEIYAASTYIPGPYILMTGATSEARFDVAEALYDSGILDNEPALETATQTFTGVFYLQSIGWVTFSSGAEYQVALDCGVQPLSSLTLPCSITGTGWSEVAGDVFFETVEYIPTVGELSGSVTTYVGDISLSGIYLALRPAVLNESLTQFANTNLAFSIAEVGKYGDGNWDMEYSPLSAYEPQYINGCSCGDFSNADFSYADTYQVILTDPSDSTTEFAMTILPEEPSTLVLDNSANFIHLFCSNHPDKCPDGATLTNSKKEQVGAGIVADGKSSYLIALKPRDMYGNRVNTGTVMVTYDATVSSVQIPIDTNGAGWVPNFVGDAPIFSGETFVPDIGNQKWETPVPIELHGQDISYDIASVAPTNNSDNIIFLSEVLYTAPDGDTSIANDPVPLEFLPAFESDVSTPTTIKVNEENAFNNTIIKNTAESFTPNIFSLFMIGSGSNAAFRDFSSSEYIDCQAYFQDFPTYAGDCNWIMMNTYMFPSIFKTPTDASFAFSGIYAPFTAFPTEEPVSYATYIHYTKANLGSPSGYFGADDIVYLSHRGTFGAVEYRAPKVKILGQNNGLGEYGNIRTSKVTRAKLMDAIRKNATILARNRTNYNDVNYTIIQGDVSITGGTFDNKRTIVVIGGDITIENNLDERSAPVAIVALTDNGGNGGNIYIDDSVTDIHASLVSEHSVRSSGDSQLYIHGSVIGANTIGDTLAHICPYYVTAVCDETEAKKYDLEYLRTFDGTNPLKAASAPSAANYSSTPLVIEYDMGLQRDPPPVMY